MVLKKVVFVISLRWLNRSFASLLDRDITCILDCKSCKTQWWWWCATGHTSLRWQAWPPLGYRQPCPARNNFIYLENEDLWLGYKYILQHWGILRWKIKRRFLKSIFLLIFYVSIFSVISIVRIYSRQFIIEFFQEVFLLLVGFCQISRIWK